MIVRLAEERDVPALLEIYRPHVEGSAVSFEDRAPTVEEFAARVQVRGSDRPWLVAEIEGAPAGYAYAGTFRTRAAYRWCAETAVYVAGWAQRLGVGRRLYGTLVALARVQGYRTLIAGITLPNAASAGLHEAVGFVRTGTWPRCGFKMGRWWDVGVWSLELGPYEGEPEEPRGVGGIDPRRLLETGLTRSSA